MKIRFQFALAALLSSLTIGANAATIDFTPIWNTNQNPQILPSVTINNLSGGTVLTGPRAVLQGDGFCFVAPGDRGCEANGEMVFTQQVRNLLFDITGAGPGDFVSIFAFRGSDLLGSINTSMDETLDFSSFGPISRLYFEDHSSNWGVGYSAFRFDVASASIPEPTSSLLLVLGLAGLIYFRRQATQDKLS